jgi:hypothetical protein
LHQGACATPICRQVLEEELDKEFVRGQYEALNELVRTVPDKFEQLAKILTRLTGIGE